MELWSRAGVAHAAADDAEGAGEGGGREPPAQRADHGTDEDAPGPHQRERGKLAAVAAGAPAGAAGAAAEGVRAGER